MMRHGWDSRSFIPSGAVRFGVVLLGVLLSLPLPAAATEGYPPAADIWSGATGRSGEAIASGVAAASVAAASVAPTSDDATSDDATSDDAKAPDAGASQDPKGPGDAEAPRDSSGSDDAKSNAPDTTGKSGPGGSGAPTGEGAPGPGGASPSDAGTEPGAGAAPDSSAESAGAAGAESGDATGTDAESGGATATDTPAGSGAEPAEGAAPDAPAAEGATAEPGAATGDAPTAAEDAPAAEAQAETSAGSDATEPTGEVTVEATPPVPLSILAAGLATSIALGMAGTALLASARSAEDIEHHAEDYEPSAGDPYYPHMDVDAAYAERDVKLGVGGAFVGTAVVVGALSVLGLVWSSGDEEAHASVQPLDGGAFITFALRR